jgi:hypothetical protein
VSMNPFLPTLLAGAIGCRAWNFPAASIGGTAREWR